jgi:catalase
VRDFVNDAFAHCKMIGFTAAAMPVLEATGVAERLDAGVVELEAGGAGAFVEQCRALRHWDRELATVSVG